MELKKRKLELELAATQKQLVMTSTPGGPVVTQPTQPAIVDPIKALNPKEIAKCDPVTTMPIVMPVIPKPVNMIPQQPFMPGQMPPRSTTRIAPVNPSMVNSVRLRDPRLARQTPQNIAQSQPITSQPANEHHLLPKISSRKCPHRTLFHHHLSFNFYFLNFIHFQWDLFRGSTMV